MNSGRRRLIKTAGALCLVASAPEVSAAPAVDPGTSGAGSRLHDLFGNHPSTLDVGRAVLRSGGLRDGEHGLTRLVLSHLDMTAERLVSIDQRQLAQRVRARSLLDFESGDVLDVEGWQLSRTEAHLSALVALQAGNR